jgi:hypothetical protein
MARDRFQTAKRQRETMKPPVDRTPGRCAGGHTGFHTTRVEDAVKAAKGERDKRCPRVSRDGKYLMGRQLYREICCCDLNGLPATDRLFLEDIADKVAAYAEVGKPWRSTTRQDQWLSDIHRRVGAGPR